jgi:hypothetical protein
LLFYGCWLVLGKGGGGRERGSGERGWDMFVSLSSLSPRVLESPKITVGRLHLSTTTTTTTTKQ